MVEAIIVSIVSVLFAYMAQFDRKELWLKLSITILTIFLCIGYNWGNDVVSYEAMFYNAKDYGALFDFSGNSAIIDKGEYGWVVLNRLCQPIGFWGMRILLFCFEGYVIYRLIKHYVSRDYYWMAVFFFAFNNTLMALGSSMMRQYLAMCIVALGFDIAIQTICRRENKVTNIKAIVCYCGFVLFASLFHRSALFVLPTVFILIYDFKFTRNRTILLATFVVLWFSFGYTFLISPMQYIIGDYFEEYSIYATSKGSVGIGVAFYVLMYVVILLNFNHYTRDKKIVSTFACVSILILPFVIITEFITRVSLFFSLFSIVAYPIFFKSVNRNVLKLLIIPLVGIMLYSYWSFFHNNIWSVGFYNYTTIFSVGGWR